MLRPITPSACCSTPSGGARSRITRAATASVSSTHSTPNPQFAATRSFGFKDARAGLELNPCCSPELWNAYGDALYSQGQIDRARSAYARALLVSPYDVQGRYNLAGVSLHKKG
jgi:tetratricopeptide (TPR) repeat protein